MEEAADLVSDQKEQDTLFVLHAGTNDVQLMRTEEILGNYRRMIRRYMEKSPHIIVSVILPRIDAFTGFHKKV